jgi:aqualysin 1
MRTMRPTRVLVLAAVAVLGALTFAPGAATANETSDAAGRFIVTLKDGVDARSTAAEYHRRDDVTVDYVYTEALNGFAGSFSSGAMGELARDSRIESIERDGAVHVTTDQAGATWGLDRIDQSDLPLNGTYGYSTTASNVTAYIIDTGIRRTHADFGGRVLAGATAISDGRGSSDCNGHGTHVAGTVGGSTYGVAKGVTLVPVRVLGCTGSGSWSGVIAGIDWVVGNHAAGTPAVANMSLGGSANDAVDAAVQRGITDGVTFAVAAGNESTNACNSSPARTPNALTVGATTSGDVQSSYSNYGSCVDLYAPGSSITSAWYSSDTATNTISGTSMASPHVAGAAALFLAGNPSASPSTVASNLVGAATANTLSVHSTSPNLLLYVGPPGGSTPSTPGDTTPPPSGNAPTVLLAKDCSAASVGATDACTFTANASTDVVTYRWNGGTPTSASTLTVTFSSPGPYSVSVVVTNGDGLTATDSVSVNCSWTKGGGKTKTLVCS